VDWDPFSFACICILYIFRIFWIFSDFSSYFMFFSLKMFGAYFAPVQNTFFAWLLLF
jgi:hypothetical protein